MRAIGIDLTGSEARPSGVALLCGDVLMSTKRMKTDWEMMRYVVGVRPDVVSIDSPLSPPDVEGKIYRACELELKRRGIGVYWCFLPSMKKLTLRGIALAHMMRCEGLNVIESYPGAAQDVLGIPRKRKGKELLAEGLRRFGVVEYPTVYLNAVSHDELDAVTAAIVGLCYLAGKFEQLGEMVKYIRSNTKIGIILVEKTDRLYRNLRDHVLFEDIDVEIHLVKENEVISRNSHSHAKFIHGIKVLMAKNFIDNLSEEVRKGMLEKAEGGDWPHQAPLGYINNKATRLVEVDRTRAPFIKRLFELYSTGLYSISQVRDILHAEGLQLHVPEGVEHAAPAELVLDQGQHVGVRDHGLASVQGDDVAGSGRLGGVEHLRGD